MPGCREPPMNDARPTRSARAILAASCLLHFLHDGCSDLLVEVFGEDGRPAANREDAWQRAVELLFERLAVRWTIAGAPIERQRELLQRFRAASPDERAWIRTVLREHCAEHFPDVKAP